MQLGPNHICLFRRYTQTRDINWNGAMCDNQSEEGEKHSETSLSSQLGINQASCPMDNRNIPSANEALKVRVGYILHYRTERLLFTLNPSKQDCGLQNP